MCKFRKPAFSRSITALEFLKIILLGYFFSSAVPHLIHKYVRYLFLSSVILAPVLYIVYRSWLKSHTFYEALHMLSVDHSNIDGLPLALKCVRKFESALGGEVMFLCLSAYACACVCMCVCARACALTQCAKSGHCACSTHAKCGPSIKSRHTRGPIKIWGSLSPLLALKLFLESFYT